MAMKMSDSAIFEQNCKFGFVEYDTCMLKVTVHVCTCHCTLANQRYGSFMFAGGLLMFAGGLISWTLYEVQLTHRI